MFPVSNKSQDIVDTLVNTIKNNNVEIKEETVVNDISKNDQSFIVKTQDGEFESKTVIIATGGTSVPQTGSTGDGYRFAKNLGHTITELFPTEVPITSSESFIKNKTLKGLSLKNVELSVLKKNGKKRISHQMDMIFTHFGVSGPAALRCSQFVYKEQKNQKKQDIQLQLDVFPEISLQDLENKIKKILSEEPDKYIKNALRGLIEERYLLFMLEQANINENTTFHHLSNQQLTHLAEHFKQFIFTVNGTLSIERAFVTGGGVSLKEIWPKTMMSKIQPGLFLCGEVLDIHGYTGGYNITSALVTGHVAGSEARQFIYT